MSARRLFSCKKNKVNHPQLTFNDNIVVEVKDQKQLGLTLTPNLSFNMRINDKNSKTKKSSES